MGISSDARSTRPVLGVGAPLFDRLVDLDPSRQDENPPMRVLNLANFSNSVRRDVEDLLNTRRNLGVWREEHGRTAMSYGAGDLTGLSSESPSVRARVVKEVAEALAAFEPRLTEVLVAAATPPPAARGPVGVRIEAQLRFGRVLVPVVWEVANGPAERLRLQEVT